MKKYLLIITLIFIGSLPVNAQAATWHIPAEQPPVTYTGSTGVKLSAYVKNGQFGMSIKYPGKKWTKVLLPPVFDYLDMITEVDSIQRGADDKAVVNALVDGEIPSIVIVDLTTGQIIDNIQCYQPTVSPDGRFIVYLKFHPAHFIQGSDFVMLYDLEKSPSQNRPSGIGIGDFENVGEAVYPPGTTTLSANTGFPLSKMDFVTSDFFWAPDSSGFAFTAEWPNRLKRVPLPSYNTNWQYPKGYQYPKEYKAWLVFVKTPWTFPSNPTAGVAVADTCIAREKWLNPPACANTLKGVKFGANGIHVNLSGKHKYFSYGEFHKPKLFYNYGIKPK